MAFPSAFFTGARAGANPASSTRIHANQVRAHRDRAAGVSTALHCTHTRAHILHTHAHPFAEQESSRSLVAARGASAIPSFWPASACSPGPSTLRRNCRSHGRMRVKEWLDSCGALSTNMQRAEIDHVECRSHSDLLYNARGLKCAPLAHALAARRGERKTQKTSGFAMTVFCRHSKSKKRHDNSENPPSLLVVW